MTIAHHPPEELLAAFAAGKLDEGENLVVAVHASQCPACRRFIRAVETIGGAAIESAEPYDMSKGAFEALMAQIDQSPPKTHTPALPYRPAPTNRAGCQLASDRVAGKWKFTCVLAQIGPRHPDA